MEKQYLLAVNGICQIPHSDLLPLPEFEWYVKRLEADKKAEAERSGGDLSVPEPRGEVSRFAFSQRGGIP